MRLFITGAGGFLGKHIIQKAIEKNHELFAYSSNPEKIKVVFRSSSSVHFEDRNKLITGADLFEEDDVLVNCAYPRSMDPALVSDGLDYIQKVFQKTADRGLRAIINISSQSVYDDKRTYAAEENSELNLDTIYAVGKYATELFPLFLSDRIRFTNLRLASLIGPGFDQRLVNKMVRNALANGSIQYNEGERRFSFLDVEDAANAILKLADISSANWKPVYNLGTSESYTLKDISEMIRDTLNEEYGIRIQLTSNPSESSGSNSLNCALLKKEIGEYQELTLKDSIKRIADHMRSEI